MPADTSRHSPVLIPRSNMETIDRAFYDWVKNGLAVSATYPDGWKAVPILWSGAERAHQSKADVTIRDDNGNINLPVIVLERLSVNKEKRGAYYGNILADSKGGTAATYQVARKISQTQTTKYSAAKNTTETTKSPYNIRRDNKKVVYETYTIPQPVHVNIIYKITIKAQFQQQIGDSEKMYQTTFDLRVLGYLLNDDKNSEYLEIEKRQSIVVVRTPRERIMIGNTHPDSDDGRFYKE